MSEFKKRKELLEIGRSVRLSGGVVIKTVEELIHHHPGAARAEKREAEERDDEIESLVESLRAKNARVAELETLLDAKHERLEKAEEDLNRLRINGESTSEHVMILEKENAELKQKLASYDDVPHEEPRTGGEVVEGGLSDLPNLLTEQPVKPEPTKSAKGK